MLGVRQFVEMMVDLLGEAAQMHGEIKTGEVTQDNRLDVQQTPGAKQFVDNKNKFFNYNV